MTEDGHTQVAAIFEEWLEERYPGTRWVVTIVERPKPVRGPTRPGQIRGRLVAATESEAT